jgi:hypothetical protein
MKTVYARVVKLVDTRDLKPVVYALRAYGNGHFLVGPSGAEREMMPWRYR